MNISLFLIEDKNSIIGNFCSFRQFFNSAFQPFAGRIQTDINSTVYEQMNKFVNEKLRQLQEIIQK